ncbi:hypothetical protein [Marinibactrum halimedae]|uniref:DUF2306 domain-containing protein n=1 Tax=Marinibactrum halimedae TaxID=1444977 RepID=A0AA37WP80_9GAMM|nr:hypothetical protein [Marinibactrum halimedae]MCD9459536.1 hypothetical protein [Marinibactrum halimedae]GLS28190.1 hypothetical protein GCM10007877_39090 [Marinibactrum halimedae]
MEFSPLMIIHSLAGLIGLFSGVAALIFIKGSYKHRYAGKVFGISMPLMCVSAVYIAYRENILDSLFVGLLTLYLVATAWITVVRKTQITGWFEFVAFIYVIVVGGAALFIELHDEGKDVPSLYGMVVASLIFAIGDLRVLILGGLSGAQRLARHLWRMCFAFLFSALSFGFQLQKNIPSLDENIVLLGIAVLVCCITLYWIIRIFKNSYSSNY